MNMPTRQGSECLRNSWRGSASFENSPRTSHAADSTACAHREWPLQVAGVLLTFRCRRLPENGVGDFEDVTIAVAEQCAQVPLGTSGGVMTEGFADEQVTVNIVGNQ